MKVVYCTVIRSASDSLSNPTTFMRQDQILDTLLTVMQSNTPPYDLSDKQHKVQ